MHSLNMIGFNGICNKLKLCQVHYTAGHTKTQHTCISATLRIASKTAGNPLVGFGIHFPFVKPFCSLVKFFVVLFPVFWLDLHLFHKYLSFYASSSISDARSFMRSFSNAWMEIDFLLGFANTKVLSTFST